MCSVSDGDLMEGLSQEAIALAGVWKLNKMIVLYDDNGISIDGPTSISDTVDQVKRFKSAGWAAELIDGQDQAAIAAAIARAQKSNKPSMIACKTTIGYGAPHKAGTAKAHGEALGAEELKGAKEKLGISLEPFSVPDDVLKAWREAGARGAAARQEWDARLPSSARASAPSSSAGCGMNARLRSPRRCATIRRSCWSRRSTSRREILAGCDRRDRGGDAVGIRRGLRRSHRLQQQQREDGDAFAPRRRKAASSITASASTACARR